MGAGASVRWDGRASGERVQSVQLCANVAVPSSSSPGAVEWCERAKADPSSPREAKSPVAH